MPSISRSSAASLLGTIPENLRDELLESFKQIVVNFREGRWEPSELNGGKFCEVVYSALEGRLSGTYPASASKPPNMVDACRKLESYGATFPRSLTIQIPRMLIALYEVRNNRGVGHVGGDVDPNQMDATIVLQTAKWILADLIRVFHATDTQAATEAVDSLIERSVPIIWEVEGMKRVLAPDLTYRDRALLLLYSSTGAVEEQVLRDWVERPRPADFRKILVAAHKEKLVEYRQADGLVYLSPVGVRYVEEQLPLNL